MTTISALRPMSLSGARIFGTATREMESLMARRSGAQNNSSIWLRRSELATLGVDTVVPGVSCNSATYFHVSHLTSPAAATATTIAERQLPLDQFGSLMSHGDTQIAHEALRKHGFFSPYFVPTKVVRELGLTVSPTAEAAQRTFRLGSAKGEECVNACDTSAPEAFTPKTCVEYRPVFFPGLNDVSRLPADMMRRLVAAATEHDFRSLLWVRSQSVGTFRLTVRPELDGHGVVDLGSHGTFVNGDCFQEQDRAYFYEVYRPVNQDMAPIRDRALFAMYSYNHRISNPIWITGLAARRAKVTFPDSAIAIEVPFNGRLVPFYNVQQCDNPRAFKLGVSIRR